MIGKDTVPVRSILVHVETDTDHLRLSLVTNSSYAVESLCKHRKSWTLDEKQEVLKNMLKEVNTSSDIILATEAEIEALSRVGVQVAYDYVRREFNQVADELARAGIVA